MTKLIFEGNFIAKLLPRYRKCKKIAKIFACGELNLLDFELSKRSRTKKDLAKQKWILFEFKDSLSSTG